MNFELLQRISLAVAENREVGTVLHLITSGLAEKAHFALARIWLVERAPDETKPHLQLTASSGKPLNPQTPDWSRIDGAFSRFPLGSRKIGMIGASREPVLIKDVSSDGRWIADRTWVEAERIRSFAGHPLIYRDEVLGVLGVFSRAQLGPDEFNWLQLFARHAAIAIANARAFEQIDALRSKLQVENEYLREEVSHNAGGIVGDSPALFRLLGQIHLVAPTHANVLILGESGTGKELVARAIHDQSTRRSRPLVKVNCASIPSELFESEFFGHAKGSFTGALRDRAGRFQLADGGTIFLDEIGEIPVVLQGKLLRVLQEGEFERVGDDHSRSVDVRVIAATNRDLPAEVAAGRFRQDLYYRLSVFPIVVPPLREHIQDVPVLAAHFLQQSARRLNIAPPKLTEMHVHQLSSYAWPGNVRELQHVIERAVILSRTGPLNFDLPAPSSAVTGRGQSLTKSEMKEFERHNIEGALSKTHGKIYGTGGAAELLGMKPTTLVSRIYSLGIPRPKR